MDASRSCLGVQIVSGSRVRPPRVAVTKLIGKGLKPEAAIKAGASILIRRSLGVNGLWNVVYYMGGIESIQREDADTNPDEQCKTMASNCRKKDPSKLGGGR